MVILLFNTIWHYLIHYSVMLRQFLGPKYCHHQLKCPDKSIGGGGNIITAIIEVSKLNTLKWRFLGSAVFLIDNADRVFISVAYYQLFIF